MPSWVSPLSSEPQRPLARTAGVLTASLAAGLWSSAEAGAVDDREEERRRECRRKSLLREHLRRSRTRRLTGAEAFVVVGAGATASPPAQAFGSRCALDGFPACCGQSTSELPCAGSRAFQAFCGSPADLATQASKVKQEEAAANDVMQAGTMFGLPSLEEAGWGRVDDAAEEGPRLRDVEEEHDRARAMQCLGLAPVSRYTVQEGHLPGMLLTVAKDKVPGTVPEVKALLRGLERVNHVNAVRLLQACETEDRLHLVYEACPGAGLLPRRLAEQHLLSAADGAWLLQELAAVVAFCDGQRLSVLDWSLWNVMSQSFRSLLPVKLFGIGLAGVLYDGVDGHTAGAMPPNSPVRGAFRFRPPEICRLQEQAVSCPYKRLELKDRRTADVWSLAAVTFAAITGHPPFGGASEAEVRQSVLSGRPPPISTELGDLHVEAIALLERSLQQQAAGRPSAKDIVFHPWVTTEVGRGRGGDVNAILDRLLRFARQPNVFRAVGKLLSQSLQADKEEAIREMFRTIDACGDGAIDLHEVVAVAAHRRGEVKELFALLRSQAGVASITTADFTLANIFSKGILTERMLRDVFNSIDADSSGCISAAELFQALRDLHGDLTPADVCGFIQDADGNLNLQMSFSEFCQHFPDLTCKQQELDEQRAKLLELQALCRATSSALRQQVAEWASRLREVHGRLRALDRGKRERDRADAADACPGLMRCLERARQLLARAPLAELPQDAPRLLGRRRLLRPPAREEAYGVFALDHFLSHRREAWEQRLAQLERRALHAAREEHSNVRSYEAGLVLSDALPLLQEVLRWVEGYSDEQADSLEASGELEARCPSRPWSRRGIRPTSGISGGLQQDFGASCHAQSGGGSAGADVGRGARRRVTVLELSQKLGPVLPAGCTCTGPVRAT